jgi:Family of unknown function (DUF6184)
MKTHRFVVPLTVAMFGCLLACDHPATHNSTPDVRSPPSGVTNAQATREDGRLVDELANARCDREEGCKNVGPGQKYASRDVCLDQMRGSMGNDLNPQNCPLGIDRSRFDGCLAAVRAEQCDRPLDTLARVQECRTSDMCLK